MIGLVYANSLEWNIERSRLAALSLITRKVSSITGNDDIVPLSWHKLQMPTLGELGTSDEKYTWLAALPYPVRLLEQESDKFVMKSRRAMVLELEVEGYTILNLLKKPGQKAYGAEGHYEFFLFDFVDSITREELSRLIEDKPFYLAYAGELGAAYARAHIISFSGEFTPMLMVDGSGMPSDIRWADLTSAFLYSPSQLESREFEMVARDIGQMIDKGERSGHPAAILHQAKGSFYSGFLQEYERLQSDYASNNDPINGALAKMPALEERQKAKLIELLDPSATDAAEVMGKIMQHERQ